jgi:hypothetical protein
MPTYLVESYVPKSESNLAATVAAFARSGSGARHRWSLFLPDEDICLHVLDGPSAEVVRDATVRAALRCQRISQVVLISAEHLGTQGGPP